MHLKLSLKTSFYDENDQNHNQMKIKNDNDKDFFIDKDIAILNM